MNKPPYILVDAFGEKDAEENLTGGVAKQVQVNLGLATLNYQYGYITELNETLAQWVKEPETAERMFPLIWLVQPFTLQRGLQTVYAQVDGGLRVFIMTATEQALKAKERMTEKFKPIIYPIYEQLLLELNNNVAVQYSPNRTHRFTDRYWWPDMTQELTQIVDCSEISALEFSLNNNSNCIPSGVLI